jgi:HlyD family secretion protein
VAQAGVRSAEASVAQRDSALAQARIDLARTRITSPVNGIVIKRAIERGQTVAASLQAPELFVIAQNLRDMQVEAAIDESDVGRLRTGQKASFTVDAYPGQTFEGEIRQVRKAATNVANVVTYVAVVGFANVDGKLLPGMTANVRVVTDERADVLKVPNSALRMRIAGVEPTERASIPAVAVAGAASSSSGAVATGSAASKPRSGSEGQARESGRSMNRGRIYLIDANGKPKALNVRLGVSDGSMTELLLGTNAAGELKEGTEVIVGVQSAATGNAPKAPGAGPRAPF